MNIQKYKMMFAYYDKKARFLGGLGMTMWGGDIPPFTLNEKAFDRRRMEVAFSREVHEYTEI